MNMTVRPYATLALSTGLSRKIRFGNTDPLPIPLPLTGADPSQIPLLLENLELTQPLHTNQPVILNHCHTQAIQAPSVIAKNSVINGAITTQRDVSLEETTVHGLIHSQKGTVRAAKSHLQSVQANKEVHLTASTLTGDIQGGSATLQHIKAISLKSAGNVIADDLTLSGSALIEGDLTAKQCWIGSDLHLEKKGELHNTTLLGTLYAPHQRIQLFHCKIWGNIDSNQVHAEHLELDGNLSANYLISVTGGWINGSITSKNADISLKDLIRAGAIHTQQSLILDHVFLLDAAYSGQALTASNCDGNVLLNNEHGELNVINSHCKALESTAGDIILKAAHVESNVTSMRGYIHCYQSSVKGVLSAYRDIHVSSCPSIGSLHATSGNAYIKGSLVTGTVKTDDDGFAKIHESKILGLLQGGWQHEETEIENTHIDGQFYVRTPTWGQPYP